MALEIDCFTRKDIARLLAHVIYRQLRTIHTPQNRASALQDCLDVPVKTLLIVSNTVNTNREIGEA